MRLKEFIEQVGEERAARLFRVPRRVIQSWRYGQRRPRGPKALEIIKKSPVTMDGIYGS